MRGKTIAELNVGDSATFRKTITETDVYLFAGISGDLNPAHIDEEASKSTMFGGRIAHGVLSAGLISAVLGMKLPGPGSIYLSQSLRFTRPVRFGDTLEARAEVLELQPEKNRARMKTTVVNQNGETVIEGEALIMPPKEA